MRDDGRSRLDSTRGGAIPPAPGARPRRPRWAGVPGASLRRAAAIRSFPCFVLIAVVAALPFALAGCSSAPQAPPGGEAASKAAYAAGEEAANALRRPIERGKSDRAAGDLAAVRRALEQFQMDASTYPEAPNCAELAGALSGMRTNVPDLDPWGNPYECRSAAGGFVLRSSGQDGAPGTDDDIVVQGGAPPSP